MIFLPHFLSSPPYLFVSLDQQGGQDQGQDQGQNQDGGDSTTVGGDDGENRPSGDDNTSRPDGDNQGGVYYPDTVDGAAGNGTETGTPAKKGMSWLPIIIIAGAILGLILIGLIVLLIRKKRAGGAGNTAGYNRTATNEPGGAQTVRG